MVLDDVNAAKDVVPLSNYKGPKGYTKSKYDLSAAELDEMHKQLPPARYTFTDEEKRKLLEFRDV